MRPAGTWAEQLGCFLWAVVRPAVPRLGWLVLGIALLSWLNLIFLAELWPHHPLAESWFAGLLLVCSGALPWVGAHTAQRVRPHLRQRCWRALWQLAAYGAYAVAAMSTGLLALGLLIGLLS